MELPQVGRYLTTQQYLPHYDAFNLDEADGARFASNGGQRTVTALVYLNDVSSGGHTSFPHLAGAAQNQNNNQNNEKEHSDDHNDSDNSDNHTTTTSGSPSQQRQQLEVRPTRGTALVFFPATVDGHLDPRTLHAALPAVDTKFVSQIWIRQGN
jgi:prolyl 4-hydroxylase